MKIIKVLIMIMLAVNIQAHCKKSKDFIHELKNKMDDIIYSEEKTNQVKMLQEVIQNNIDLQKISRFIMGKHWTLTQETIRESFIKEYKEYFVRLCIKVLHDYITKSCDMMIMGEKKIDDQTYVVNTRLSYDNGEKFTNIDLQVTEKNGSLIISDIILSGTSISINQRTIFSKKIDTYGIEQVVKELKYNNNL